MPSCKQCENELPENAQFCPNCGAAVAEVEESPSQSAETSESEDAAVLSCRQCGKELSEADKFCTNCGTSVEQSEPSGVGQSVQPSTGVAESAGVSAVPIPQSDRNMAMLCHLAAFAGFVIPFGNIIGPLVIWLLRREDATFVDYHGKEAVNFQISMTIYFIVSAILILLIIGIFMLIGLAIFELIVIIIAAIRANEGAEYRYPLSIRFLK